VGEERGPVESGHKAAEANGADEAAPPARPTLDAAVRKRRADRAFYIRLAGAIRQNQRALQRLQR
jgi:hypothetical protein